MGKKGLSKKSARVPKSSAVEQEKASSSTPKEAGSDSLSGPKKAANDSSPTPKKAGNEVDKIFAVKKRKNREQEKAEKPAEDASAKGKKLKRKKNKKKDPIESNGFVGETTQPMKRTGDGLSLYTEEELGIGNANAGGTPLCPFDCDFCFWSGDSSLFIVSCFLVMKFWKSWENC
ncbi:unnamed protein product [Ilex paraguariensis]|uniref:Uncharacterized protein n=1 Tax=Ilex paraguariensis TaxID=185542 RepID=A0ABC8RG81_9AQUA